MSVLIIHGHSRQDSQSIEQGYVGNAVASHEQSGLFILTDVIFGTGHVREVGVRDAGAAIQQFPLPYTAPAHEHLFGRATFGMFVFIQQHIIQ